MLPIRRREYHDGLDDGLLVIVMRAAQPGKHVAAARTVREKKNVTYTGKRAESPARTEEYATLTSTLGERICARKSAARAPHVKLPRAYPRI